MSSSNPIPDPVTVFATCTTKQRRPRSIAAVGSLFHPKSSAGIATKDWYTRVTLDTKRVNFPLGQNRRKAEQLDRELRARLISGETVSAVQAYVAQQLNRDIAPPAIPLVTVVAGNGQPWATVGDLFKIRSTYKFTAKAETTRQYEFSFLKLIELALLFRADRKMTPTNRSGRRVTLANYLPILALPLSILTDELVDEFQQARMTQAEREKRNEISSRITTNTELRQARAVLTHRALVACRRAKLNLPDFKPFLEAPILEKAKRIVVAPHEDVIRNLHTSWRSLRGDRPLFIVIALALYAGLRRSEILHAHARWLQTTTGPSLVLRFADGFETKNGEERTIGIPLWLHDELKAIGPDYFIGPTEGTRRATLARAVSWLRGHGFTTVGKPLHAVRSLYAGYLLTRFPLMVVRQRLGHADIKTTLDHYANNPFCEAIARLWEEDVSAAPSAAA